MTRYKLGIIGNGFVGESLAFAFSPVCDIKIYDVDILKSTNTIEAGWKTNLEVRPERDWEKLLGRAISK